MRVAIIFVFMDFHRRGRKNHSLVQPGIGPLIASLLPSGVEVDVINETWDDVDWDRDYDLIFISSQHSDFDRARQVSHYWRCRGAGTVYGGVLASTYPGLCEDFFDAVVVGDPEGIVPRIVEDFRRGDLEPLYVAPAFDAARLPVPRFDLFAGRHRVPLCMEATRGCPFTCEFCALSGLGTRFHARPPEMVARDVRAGQRMLCGLVPRHQRRMVSFQDNNIGGNPTHLRKLCAALEPLDVRWGSAVTFNVLSNPGMVETLSRSGCRFMFMGLESFNPATLHDMGKFQNLIDKTRTLLDQCRRRGILVVSGLMLSSTADDLRYIRTIPDRLTECGLHLPTFICFECPLPGTPYFHRLVAEAEPAFLPGAYLRDFTGYTLVARPRLESVESFVDGYRWVLDHTYTRWRRLLKAASDVPRFLARGWWDTALLDLGQILELNDRPDPARSYLAGTDAEPPEATTVPLTDGDFASEAQRRAIVEPWRVTDAEGRILPMWRRSIKIFDRKGTLSAEAAGLSKTA